MSKSNFQDSERTLLLYSSERTSFTTRHDDRADKNKACNLSNRQKRGIFIIILCEILIVLKYGSFEKVHNTFLLDKAHHPYNKTQALGFQIYSGGAPAKNNVTEEMNPECFRFQRYGLIGEGEDATIQCYIGQEDPLKDVHERLKIMRHGVERAYEVSDKSPSTMKMFIAPEFFFRGLDGAYEFNAAKETMECGPICHILRGLEDITADARFEDWLFVFGTVVAYEQEASPSNEYLFYNFAPIYKGFDPTKTNHYGKRFILPKRYTSNLDFLTPQRNVNLSYTMELVDHILPVSDDTLMNPHLHNQRLYDDNVWLQYKDELSELGYIMIDYDWIIIDGITFSIEICVDHLIGSALKIYLADIVTGSETLIPKVSTKTNELLFVGIPKHQAQVSIVASSGMTLNVNALALTQNGTVYLQDGMYNDPAGISYSKPHVVDDTTGGSEAIRRRAVLSKSDIYFEYNVLSGSKKYSVYGSEHDWRNALNGTFSTIVFEPAVVAWEPQILPPIKRMPL